MYFKMGKLEDAPFYHWAGTSGLLLIRVHHHEVQIQVTDVLEEAIQSLRTILFENG